MTNFLHQNKNANGPKWVNNMNINEFWNKVLAKDRDRLKEFFSEDAVIRWICTNEQFTVSEYIKANCDYPGDWDGSIERIEESGDTLILAGHVFPPDKSSSYHVVSFIKLKNNRICEMDEYWADDGEPPAWRTRMHIGKPIFH